MFYQKRKVLLSNFFHIYFFRSLLYFGNHFSIQTFSQNKNWIVFSNQSLSLFLSRYFSPCKFLLHPLQYEIVVFICKKTVFGEFSERVFANFSGICFVLVQSKIYVSIRNLGVQKNSFHCYQKKFQMFNFKKNGYFFLYGVL